MARPENIRPETKNNFQQRTEKDLYDLSDEEFSLAADRIIDNQFSEKLINDILEVLKTGKNVYFITSHFGYFEVEALSKIMQEINEFNNQEKPIEAHMLFSAPAIALNVPKLFTKRREYYKKSHLNLYGIVRPEDETPDSKYKDSITQEMKDNTITNFKNMSKEIAKGGCIVIVPLAASLESGRINSETGNINGMGVSSERDVQLRRILKTETEPNIVPLGIDGAQNALDSSFYKPSQEFLDAIDTPPKEKLIVIRAEKLINTAIKYPNKDDEEIAHLLTCEVASCLVSPISRGYYHDKI